MKAAVLYKKGDFRLGDWPTPKPAPGEILIRVRECGICGSDVPRIWGGEAHFFPIVLGHEFSGEVAELGEGVTSFAVGDRVAGVPLKPCMQCEDCMRGNYSLCRHYQFIGSRQQGAFAEYVAVPAQNAVKISDSVTFEMGALFEPSTVALHGIRCSGMRGGQDVAILGTGNIGILAMQWAKIMGAKRTAVFDIFDERLELAARLGADAVFNTTKENWLEEALAYTGGRGFEQVFETAGQPATIKNGFRLVCNHGQMTCIGTPHKDLTFGWQEWEALNRKEFHLTGTWMSYSAPFPGAEWTQTAHYFSTGQLKLDPSMIYARIPLSRCTEAAELFLTPGLVKGKVLLVNDITE